MKSTFLVICLLAASPVFAAAPSNISRQNIAVSADREDVSEFNQMDTNKDNRISKDEYLAALKSEGMSQEQIDKSMKAFDQIDLNSDGYISLSEYRKFMNFAIETINKAMKAMQNNAPMTK